MRKIVHGTKVYGTISECVDKLGISYYIISKLLKTASPDRPAMLLGKPIYEIKPNTEIKLAVKSARRCRPLLPGLCKHRLGIDYGGRC